jgi:hypothetical protein
MEILKGPGLFPKILALTPAEFDRMTKLAQSSYRPKEILEQQRLIEAETKAAELKASITGEIDDRKIEEIVKMKIHLDVLYSQWIKGEIS